MQRLWMVLLVAGLWPGIVFGMEAQTIDVGRFSVMAPGDAVEGWDAMTFPKIESHTRYRVVEMDGMTVLRADSNASASGLIRKIGADPKDYPLLTWTWRVSNVLANGDVTKKSGDDYPARIYVTFAEDANQITMFQRTKRAAVKLLYGMAPPSAAIAYVWATRAEVGSIHPNAFTDRCRMIVVESGPAHLNQWRSAQRNIVADFRSAFGTDPPRITGVAVMTDTDNTAESATAWYGDIALQKKID